MRGGVGGGLGMGMGGLTLDQLPLLRFSLNLVTLRGVHVVLVLQTVTWSRQYTPVVTL